MILHGSLSMRRHIHPSRNCQTSRTSTPGSWRQSCKGRRGATTTTEVSVTTRGGTICSEWLNSLWETSTTPTYCCSRPRKTLSRMFAGSSSPDCLAIIAGAAFIPVVWIFGSGMSRSLKSITAEAVKLQKLAEPDPSPVTSRIKEIYELGSAMKLAQRAIWSFARFIPKELVQRVIDNSISTELGGVREEITVVFTDVRDFTTIAESAEPDILMLQTSRYFSVLTEAFLAEGGTIDKFIGDAVMVFWNAPNPQPDHIARACRAVLAARAANERLNTEFEADGLKPFVTRFGIHVGEAVVGNVGSTERMNYTALGNTVNLAARLEGLNKEFGTTILVSEDVYRRVEYLFEFKALDAVVAKGMTKETRVFELLGAST